MPTTQRIAGLATVLALCNGLLKAFVVFGPGLARYLDPTEAALLLAVIEAVKAFLALKPFPGAG
jgi:hypothetical protein